MRPGSECLTAFGLAHEIRVRQTLQTLSVAQWKLMALFEKNEVLITAYTRTGSCQHGLLYASIILVGNSRRKFISCDGRSGGGNGEYRHGG